MGEAAGRTSAPPGAPVADGHDHHIHLFAAAAALASARCGPEHARDRAGLARALRAQEADARGWVRGVGYCESVAGALDRAALDALAPERPLRLQHRSGQLWMLNSAGVARLGLDADRVTPEGVERDGSGRATGRIYRLDAWLRERLGTTAPPSLATLGRRLAACGIARVTDATPTNGPAEIALLAAARARGELPQEVVVMGTLALADVEPPPGMAIGPVKLHLAEAALPALDDAIETIRAAHAQGRAVAVHATSRVELLFALAALEAAGVRPGDRLEHVHVAAPEDVAAIARLGLTVCTSPALVAARRDAWVRDAEPAERPWVAPLAALARARVPLLLGSDAPYGPLAADAPPLPARAEGAARASRRGPTGSGPGSDTERATPRCS